MSPERMNSKTGLFLVVAALAGAGCGASATQPQVAPVAAPVTRAGEELPGWTQRETWTDATTGTQLVYAVGMDEQLDAGEENSRAAASGRAREALARYVSVSVKTFLRRGGARDNATAATTTTVRTGDDRTRTQTTSNTTESTDRMLRAAEEISQETLHGVEVSFVMSERRGIVYALAQVPLARITEAFESAPSLSAEERARIHSNAAEARAAMTAAFEQPNGTPQAE